MDRWVQILHDTGQIRAIGTIAYAPCSSGKYNCETIKMNRIFKESVKFKRNIYSYQSFK